MKKIICIVGIVLLANCARAQKIDSSNVPDVIKKSFTKIFPGIGTVKWEKEKNDYEVSFKKDKHDMSALFMNDGMLMETETDIAVTALPANVIEYLKNHYKGKVIKEAAIIIKSNGEKNYEAEVDNVDIIFDASGKFLKEVKEND